MVMMISIDLLIPTIHFDMCVYSTPVYSVY